MALMTMTVTSLQLQRLQDSKWFCFGISSNDVSSHGNTTSIHFYDMQQRFCSRLASSLTNGRVVKHVSKPISGVGQSQFGFKLNYPKSNAITVEDAKIVVESQEEDKIQLRVDLTGDETKKVFNKVLTNLASTAPPIPGFRRQKGGKTTEVPREVLIGFLGKDNVTNFTVHEIITSTVADYVKKENLNVKDNKVDTTQDAKELRKAFTPGNEFGFNAILELEKPPNEPSS